MLNMVKPMGITLLFDLKDCGYTCSNSGNGDTHSITTVRYAFISGKWKPYVYTTVPAATLAKSLSPHPTLILTEDDYAEFSLIKDTGYEPVVSYFQSKYEETP